MQSRIVRHMADKTMTDDQQDLLWAMFAFVRLAWPESIAHFFDAAGQPGLKAEYEAVLYRMNSVPAPSAMLVSDDPTPIARAEEVGTVTRVEWKDRNLTVEFGDKNADIQPGDRVWVGR